MTSIHGFELLLERDIPEINTKARRYRHIKTGAELLSLQNDDENKSFGINFRTPPADSTGVAHIMEHSVLCASRKYPLKEPFIELAKGSLKTFLNAFTYPDKTCYPVASTNTQDFYNLIDVYLDCVLYPQLNRHTFQQEGWHHELDAADEPLAYKGVVFNEMKGVYASPDSVMSEKVQQSLFPDNTYGVDSGGDPEHIPDLTYEQFKAFHQQYYHPSNSYIFFYGDDDPEQRLRLMDERLKDFHRQDVQSEVPLQARFTAPRHLTAGFAVDADSPNADKGMISVNWMLDEVTDPQERLALHILAHVLINTSASELHKALIDSGLGEEATGGAADHLRQNCFYAGLKGIALEDAPRVEQLILETLERLATDGIDPLMIEAAMNTAEFHLRENNTGSFPRGLALMVNSLDGWLHGRDPLDGIAFEAPLQGLKARLQREPRYLESLLRHHILNNRHRTTLVMEPDVELEERREQAEHARLQRERGAMSPAQIEAIVANTRQLKLLQETPDSAEALATIPSLQLSDLDPRNKTTPATMLQQTGVPTLYHDLFTNGIIYADIGFDLRRLPAELLRFVPMFGRCLLSIGTETQDFVRLAQRIGSKTGGLRQTVHNSSVRDSDEATAWLFLRGKALPAQTPDLLAILRDVLLTTRFDNQERFKQMVLEEKASLESHLVPGGSSFVAARLRSHFNQSAWLGEQMGGVSYLFFVRELAERVDSDWPGVLQALEQIRTLLLDRSSMICNVTVDEANWQQFSPQLSEFLAGLPAVGTSDVTWQPVFKPLNEGLAVPSQVNFVGKAANIYQSGYKRHGSSAVITKYLNTTWLWERVRMRGGAYGGFCGLDLLSGLFHYGSYRDPNLLETLKNYDGTANFLREVELSPREITRSIIGTISDMDFYQLPDAKGWRSLARHLAGETDANRQQLRDEVLGTTDQHFRAFADALEPVNQHGLVVAMGSQDALDAANVEQPGFLQVTKVL